MNYDMRKVCEDFLEEGVYPAWNVGPVSDSDLINLSIAASLKRIADALEKGSIGENIYNAISQAMIEDMHRRG